MISSFFRRKTQPRVLQQTMPEVHQGPTYMSATIAEWRNKIVAYDPFVEASRDAMNERPLDYGLTMLKRRFVIQLENIIDRALEQKHLIDNHIQHLQQPTALASLELNRLAQAIERFLETCKVQQDLGQKNQGWLADQLKLYELGYQQGLTDAGLLEKPASSFKN